MSEPVEELLKLVPPPWRERASDLIVEIVRAAIADVLARHAGSGPPSREAGG